MRVTSHHSICSPDPLPLVESEKHFKQGVAYWQEEKYDQAITECTSAIELDPDFTKAYIARATAYADKGEFDKTIADCNKAIELDPNCAKAYLLRGAVYAAALELEEVKPEDRENVRLSPIQDLQKALELSQDPEVIRLAKQAIQFLQQMQ